MTHHARVDESAEPSFSCLGLSPVASRAIRAGTKAAKALGCFLATPLRAAERSFQEALPLAAPTVSTPSAGATRACALASHSATTWGIGRPASGVHAWIMSASSPHFRGASRETSLRATRLSSSAASASLRAGVFSSASRSTAAIAGRGAVLLAAAAPRPLSDRVGVAEVATTLCAEEERAETASPAPSSSAPSSELVRIHDAAPTMNWIRVRVLGLRSRVVSASCAGRCSPPSSPARLSLRCMREVRSMGTPLDRRRSKTASSCPPARPSDGLRSPDWSDGLRLAGTGDVDSAACSGHTAASLAGAPCESMLSACGATWEWSGPDSGAEVSCAGGMKECAASTRCCMRALISPPPSSPSSFCKALMSRSLIWPLPRRSKVPKSLSMMAVARAMAATWSSPREDLDNTEGAGLAPAAADSPLYISPDLNKTPRLGRGPLLLLLLSRAKLALKLDLAAVHRLPRCDRDLRAWLGSEGRPRASALACCAAASSRSLRMTRTKAGEK
mmetsp:Transcript_17701/g.51455  ORF Transcript_17701/g.51455 Transcript_17701/m.51455 type:complete len:504 (+) Transcript_17701:2137-3648(+)